MGMIWSERKTLGNDDKLHKDDVTGSSMTLFVEKREKNSHFHIFWGMFIVIFGCENVFSLRARDFQILVLFFIPLNDTLEGICRQYFEQRASTLQDGKQIKMC